MADCMIIQGYLDAIPARGPYPTATETNKYCCHSHLYIVSLIFIKSAVQIWSELMNIRRTLFTLRIDAQCWKETTYRCIGSMLPLTIGWILECRQMTCSHPAGFDKFSQIDWPHSKVKLTQNLEKAEKTMKTISFYRWSFKEIQLSVMLKCFKLQCNEVTYQAKKYVI